MKRLLRAQKAKARDLRSIARSLHGLREQFRKGQLAWEEYILHGSSPHSLSAVDERRFRDADPRSSAS